MRIRRNWLRSSALVFVGAALAAFLFLLRRLPSSVIFHKSEDYCPLCFGEDFCPTLAKSSLPVRNTWLNYRNVYFGADAEGNGKIFVQSYMPIIESYFCMYSLILRF